MLRTVAILGVLYIASGCRRGTEPPPLNRPAPEWMERAVHEQIAPLGASRLLRSVFRGVTRDEDESVHWQVKLDQGKCYAFSAVGSESVEELKLYVFNSVGQRLFSKEGSNRVIASFCVTGQLFVGGGAPWGWPTVAMATPGMYDLELKTTEGHGHMLLGVFVQEQGTDGAPSPAPSASAAPPPVSVAPPAAGAPPQEGTGE